MPFTLTMPKLSPTMEEGTIVKWHKKNGDRVEAGDLLFEVATDKATVEHQALDEGWMRQIIVPEGKEAMVNQAVAIMSETQDESLEGYQVEGETKKESELPKSLPTPQKEEKRFESQTSKSFIPEPPLEVALSPCQPLGQHCGPIKASPLAKKIAKEKGVDLAGIQGSGPRGRITSKDLEGKALSNLPGRNLAEESRPPAGSYVEHPLSPMRKMIGQRLQDSKSFIPHFYLNQSVNAAPLLALREQLKEHDFKFTINDFIIKAVAMALRKYPSMNAGFHATHQSIIHFQTIDIAVAVSINEGLMTPIIRHADYKKIEEISAEVRQLATRAKEGKLENHEYKGGSFTLSNLGMYGIPSFQAIINPPQAAILAVGAIQEIPIVEEGNIVPGKIMMLTLSVDHRVIDGSAASLFLVELKKILESPAFLLIN